MKSLKTNFLANIVNQLLGVIVPFITTPFLSRILGASKLGEFSYSSSVAYYFMLLGLLGMANYGSREIAKCRDNEDRLSRTFSGIYTTQVLCATTATVIYLVYIFFNADALAKVMLLSVISVLLDINWFYYGLEKFDYILLRNVLVKLLTTICIFLFVKSANDVVIYALIVGVGSIFGNWVLWWNLKKKIKYFRPSLAEITKHLVSNLTLFLPVLVLSFYKVMDKLMLKWMTSYEQVGYYENADKVGLLPLFMFSSLSQIMIPRISFFVSKEQHNGMNYYLDKSIMFVSFLCTGLIFGIVAVAPEFVPLYFGRGYESCVNLIRVILPSYIFSGYANVFRSQLLIPYGKDREFSKTLIMGACINLILNILLIPKIQALGAAIATAFTEFAVFAMTYWYIRHKIRWSVLIQNNFLFYLCGIVMLVVLYFIPNFENRISSLVVKIVAGAMVYAITFLMVFVCGRYKYAKNKHEDD